MQFYSHGGKCSERRKTCVILYFSFETGKTYTMEGDLVSPEHHGIIPRAAQAIFETLSSPCFSMYSVSCSYLEIYNEDLCDLLADSCAQSTQGSDGPNKKASKLEILDNKNGTFCRGLSERHVQSSEEVLALMQQAQQYRKVGETRMNKNSSRSHCIFTLKIQAKRSLADGGVLEINGKLHMVDLAGSECAKTAIVDKAAGVSDQFYARALNYEDSSRSRYLNYSNSYILRRTQQQGNERE
jgi:hypothetical protein